MPFLLMVFLVLVCLPAPEVWLGPQWTKSPWPCVAATWCVVLLSGFHAWLVARRVSGRLANEPSLREQLLNRYEGGRSRQQIILIVFYILSLLGLGWGWSVAQLWRGGGTLLPGAEVLILAPFVAAQLLSWMAYYDAESAAHRAAHRLLVAEPQGGGAWLELERSRAASPPVFGSRASYVFFQLRQKMALVLLPVLMLLMQKELARLFPDVLQEWQKSVDVLGIVAVLIVFAAMPWIVRLVLGLKPLPAGPLRHRLQASARRLRFRYSNLLLWNTRNGMANAMVVGILPWLRYVVFTDRLLEEFTAEEVEAVFGHEVGHVRHHHMLYYFAFLTGSVIVLFWLISGAVNYVKVAVNAVGPTDRQAECIVAVALVGVLLAYVFVVFGYLSRRCERQADVFGCRAVSCSSPLCCGHESDDELDPRGKGLCPTGINTFICALEKVASLNGISRDRPGFLQSWQHASIGRRVAFLQLLLVDSTAERRFQHRLGVLKWLLLFVLGGAAAFILVHESEPPLENALPGQAAMQKKT